MKRRNNLKRKATNSLNQLAYLIIWHEDPPQRCKKVKCYENKKKKSKEE